MENTNNLTSFTSGGDGLPSSLTPPFAPLFDTDNAITKLDEYKEVRLEKKSDIVEFTLPSGKKVEMDLSRFKIRTIMNARACAQGGFKTTLYILADICKFNGQIVTVPEMDEWDGYDLLALEEEWDKARNNIPKHQV